MDVFAFVGPSGTGKSHRALIVAHEQAADALIDDGLFIKDSKIIAGKSAKKEPNKIGAVRRAIFTDPEHAAEVREAIERVKPQRILVLGTSDGMVEKIVRILKLPPIQKIIRIEEIASPTEIAKARKARLREGKHIIPVPTIELKPHFSGYLVDSLEIFSRRSSATRRKLGEKSIVRPTFSYYGKLLIADDVLVAVTQKEALDTDFIAKVGKVQIRKVKDKGDQITADLVVRCGTVISQELPAVQRRIREAVEYTTGMTVFEVNLVVRSLSMD